MMQVKSGDLNKLGLLYERYKRPLYGFFYNTNLDGTISEDLVQGVFERVLKYKHGFKGNGSFKTWLFHIARNVNIDHHKKNNRRPETVMENVPVMGLTIEASESREEESIRLLERAMTLLDYEKREILTLSKLKGMKYKEIGAIMDCSEGAVKVKVFRALRELKTMYTKLESEFTES